MNNHEIINSQLKKELVTIDDVCKKNGVPYFLVIAGSDNGQETEYHTQFLTPGVSGTKLSDDKITKMLNVMNGFNTVPPTPVPEFFL